MSLHFERCPKILNDEESVQMDKSPIASTYCG